MNKLELQKFVKFYNEINKNKITTRDVINKPYITGLFEHTKTFLAKYDTVLVEKGIIVPTSTKSDSFLKLNTGHIDNKVLDSIIENPGKTRSELAMFLGVKIQTLCGSVNRLIESKQVKIDGEKFDSNTNRTVGKLRAV